MRDYLALSIYGVYCKPSYSKPTLAHAFCIALGPSVINDPVEAQESRFFFSRAVLMKKRAKGQRWAEVTKKRKRNMKRSYHS